MGGCNKPRKNMHWRGVKWQAPSLGCLFDSPFNFPLKIVKSNIKSQQIKMTPLELTALKFVYENSINGKECTRQLIVNNLKNYWKQNIPGYVENRANIMHYIKNPQFYGLIDELQTSNKHNSKFILSIDGRRFYEYLTQGNYLEAMRFFILNLLRVKYPNPATKNTMTPSLYPFRILFWLFKKYEILTDDDLTKWIPFIIKRDDLNRDTFETDKPKYEKWKSWVTTTLLKLHILKKTGKIWSVDNDHYPIWDIINETNLIDDIDAIFINENIEEIKQKTRFGFTETLKRSIKIANNWKCWFDPNHPLTCKTNGETILDVHHIIPVEMKKSFPELTDINCEDNLIPLCPSPCHTTIHHGRIEDMKKYVDIIWERRKYFLSKYLSSPDELLSIYQRIKH